MRVVVAWGLSLVLPMGLAAAEARVLEAESFQFAGGWAVARDAACSGTRLLQANPDARRGGRLHDAVTALAVDEAGEYRFWARARDFAQDRPGVRRFRLLVDGAPLEREAGNHGQEGFAWQLLGARSLAAGPHLLALRDTTGGFGRCDALYITRGDGSPERLSPVQLARLRVKPEPLAAAEPEAFRAPALSEEPGPPLATLESAALRVAFRRARDAAGAAWIVRHTSVRDGAGRWQALPPAAGEEALVLLTAPSVWTNQRRIPVWSGARVPVEVRLNGVTAVTCASAEEPYTAAPAARLVPVELAAADASSVELLYRAADGLAVPVRWSLDPDEPYALRAQARLTLPQAGYASLGFSAVAETARERVRFVQLPPLYQFQRLPVTPDLLPNTLTPHALALAELPWLAGGAPLVLGVTAEPRDLPFVWPDATNAVCGFALLNSRSRVQPAFFSPVLGSPHSRLAAGETRVIRWRVLTRPGAWTEALEACCASIFKVADYREPVGASLTEAALNMVDLMMDDEHGGWDRDLMGFYDIESATMGKHAAPLALLSAAVLTRSERVWNERALPTLAFLLSRRGSDLYQSGTNRVGAPVRGQLEVPGRFYGTTCWEGAARLTRGLNPWLRALALPEGGIRHATAYNASWPWTELLAAHRLDPARVPLATVQTNADHWLAQAVYGRQTQPVDFDHFYNIHFYPYWWDALDLYEASGEPRYLAAAEAGAFHTLAGLWSHPPVPAGTVTVHPDGSQVTYHRVWHKNDRPFRLGWPRQPGDTPAREVPAWQVSPVGLGLEQPSTYTAFDGAMNNIMQSTWAPHLLRVYRHTGRACFRTFARNSAIGRFANYPGYYLTCFTDLVHDPAYPYQGPDITSLYYHHIPVHFAFTVDYLVADAEARSAGRVRFPWVKQKNYAWFNNRVYTAEPGRVYDDDQAVLWLERGLVRTDSVKTDWLAARSPTRFWALLLNQTRATNAVALRIDAARAGLLPGGAGVLHRESGPPVELPPPADGALTVELPPLGFAAIGLPAAPGEPFPAAPPRTRAHRTAPAGAFGQAHAFTIRSPWGRDAVYGVLTSDPLPGARVTFTCGRASRVCARYPYEALFPDAADPDAPLEVLLERPGAAAQTLRLEAP